jgi:hypothetical protein
LVCNGLNIPAVLKSELAAVSDREGELIGNMKCFADSPTTLTTNSVLVHVRIRPSSGIWSDLLKIVHIYLKDGAFELNNAKLVSLWLDTWLHDKPLCSSYPILYELSLN